MKVIEILKHHLIWRKNDVLIKLNSVLNGHSEKGRIVVFGSGRSGTNLLSGFLNSSLNSIVIEEPLMNSSSKMINKIGFAGWSQHIPENANWPEAKDLLEGFFNGRNINPNHYQGDIIELYNANMFIYRFIRANLLVPWMIKNFEIQKPIYLIRNPYSVIASQLQHEGFGFKRPIQLSRAPSTKNFKYYEEFYRKYESLFQKASRIEEALIIQWIMQNEYVVSHRWHDDKWITISYEDLISDPDIIRNKVNSCLNMHLPSSANEIIRRPSRSTVTELVDRQDIKHRKYLLEEQAEIIDRYLSASVFKDVYSY